MDTLSSSPRQSPAAPGARLAAFLILIATAAGAQYPMDPDSRGTISGAVVDSTNGRPMPRVQVTLKPVSGSAAPVAARTRGNGRFEFKDLPSGYYSLEARHQSYLPSSFAQTEHTRLPYVFGLMPGENLDGIYVRLRPAGVISGKVEFPDGAPTIGTPVEFYREYFYRGRHGFQRIGSARTDDRGLYRIFGLPPGRYYIVASYSPPAPALGVREQLPTDENGRPLPEDNFVTTYFRSTSRLLESMPVRLRYSEQLEHTDILLAKARAARVTGRVVSGVTGKLVTGAVIRLRQPSPVADVMVDAPAAVRPKQDGGFEIVGVTPGAYTLIVHTTEDGRQLIGQVPLTVSGSEVGNVAITLEPFRELLGNVVTEDEEEIPLSLFRVALEPHSDSTPSSAAQVQDDGSFTTSYVPGETYDVFLLDGPPNSYLKSARIGGFDVLQTGFRAERGALPPMELEYSGAGAVVRGEIADTSTKVALGATVVLVPDPARGKIQYYKMTTTDAYGLYRFDGVAPGSYTVASWWDEPPCEIYDLESLEACREIGKSVDVKEREEKLINMPVAR